MMNAAKSTPCFDTAGERRPLNSAFGITVCFNLWLRSCHRHLERLCTTRTSQLKNNTIGGCFFQKWNLCVIMAGLALLKVVKPGRAWACQVCNVEYHTYVASATIGLLVCLSEYEGLSFLRISCQNFSKCVHLFILWHFLWHFSTGHNDWLHQVWIST